jgi:mxaJ protein
MCFTSSLSKLAVVVALCGTASAEPLRVCADPNNMPFSNKAGEGFENAIAQQVAKDLGRTVAYTWFPQRRGFIKNTLKAGKCDLVIGEPVGFDLAAVTTPYYRSTYVFVTRADRHLDVATLDDPRLAKLKIGVHMVGDDYANVPPVVALAKRGFVEQIIGYSIYGDYSQPSPPSKLIDAVANGEVDVAIVWGPLAGYVAAHSKTKLVVTPIASDEPGMTFAIGMAVRHGDADKAWQATIEQELATHGDALVKILARFSVPVVPK